jgi:endonuclease-3
VTISKMKESIEEKKSRVKDIIRKLKREIPGAKTALVHRDPLELLVATILSAQCTDERVNKVTPTLFKKYRSVQDFANANVSDFENEIKSTGFYRAKTKSIVNCCKSLIDNYGGKVPEKIEELVKLPGVGRKTANVVLGNAFGITSGIVVDTHVKRLSERLGLTKHTDPEKIEIDLMEIVTKKDWIIFGDLLVLHGRRVCNARKPKCLECSLSQLCPSAEKIMVMN